MRPFILLLSLLACGCGQLAVHKPKESKPAATQPALSAIYQDRLAEYRTLTASRAGWPSRTDCDAAVFAGAACLGGAEVDIDQAEYPTGALNRRPPPACWVPEKAGQQQESSSTASRDDATLYAACAFKKGDRGALERLLDYAAAHGGYLGQPLDLGITFLGPNLEGIIARAVVRLGGDHRPEADFSVIEAPGIKDYQQHIEVEEILFSADVAGAATDWELNALKTLVAGAPSDALFQAALGVYTGDFTEASRLLLDPASPVPSYVRGNEPDLFARAWWLRAAAVVLSHQK